MLSGEITKAPENCHSKLWTEVSNAWLEKAKLVQRRWTNERNLEERLQKLETAQVKAKRAMSIARTKLEEVVPDTL